MDLQGLQLLSTDKQREIIDGMSLADRAKTEPWPDFLTAEGIHRFPDYLSIKEIGGLLFPVLDWTLKKAFEDQLIDACIDDKLPYEGTIPLRLYREKKKPHPLEKQGLKVGDVLRMTRPGLYAEDCTIHKNEFKRYIESIGQMALVNKGLLAGWWIEDAGETSKPLSGKTKKRLDSLNPYLGFELEGVDLENAKKILGGNPRHIDQYLVGLWITTEMPDNKYFYSSLKNHTRHKVQGSPIEEWSLLQIQHKSGKPIKKRTIGTKISSWKRTVKT